MCVHVVCMLCVCVLVHLSACVLRTRVSVSEFTPARWEIHIHNTVVVDEGDDANGLVCDSGPSLFRCCHGLLYAHLFRESLYVLRMFSIS